MLTWSLLSVFSAVFLGFYDVAKKSAVRGNAVPPVLLLNVLTAALLWLIPLCISLSSPSWIPFPAMIVESISWKTHLLLALKSLLVGASWILALYALKHLPMSIAAPIRATSPFFTILISVTLMDERPSAGQWTGIIIILTAFYAFSVVGRAEGIHFHRNRWVGLMIAATILGAASALYDKHLLQNLALKPATVQAWFSVYLVPVMIPLAAHWFRNERQNAPFEWRWSIPMIAVLLLLSDFLYFTAIGQPDALISVISPLRRTSLVIAFVAGIRMYGETNWRPKLLCVLGILAGVYVLSLSR